MAWYRTGTVNVTTGSATVAGIGTSWISGASAGEGFYGPDGRIYEISAIVSATQLTLATPYLGSTQSTAAYVIVPSQSYLRDLALQAATLVNDYASVVSGVGIGKFDDGTLASPGIRFTADENTGMRRVGADNLALVTGGSDRLTVTSSATSVTGNLGVGTSSPLARLQIVSSAVSGEVMRFIGTDRTFSISQGGTEAPLGGISIYDRFIGAQRISLDGNGNVGIGTSSPTSRLSVVSAGTTLAQFIGAQYSQIRHSDGTRTLFTQVFDNAAALFTETATPLLFGTNNAERMRLDASGNVVIGTTTALAKLDVVGGNSDGLQYRTGTRTIGIGQVASEASLYWGSGTALTFFSGSERMRLDSSGNLGIGTSLPVARLDVRGAYASTDATVSATPIARLNHGGAVSWWFGGSAYNYMWAQAIQDDGTNNIKNMVFQPLGGSIGVGVLPGNTLDVNGVIRARGDIYAMSTGDRIQLLPQAAGNGGIIATADSTFSAYRTMVLDASSHVFRPNGTEGMRLTSTGLGIGTSFPSAKFVVVQNGAGYASQATYKGDIQIVSGPASLQATGGLEFLTSTFSNGYGWKMSSIDSTGVHLVFGNRSDSASWTERMRLNSSGNLAVGIDSPSARLHVNAPSGLAFIASDIGYTASQVNIGISVLTAGRPFIGTNAVSNPLEIGTRSATETIFVTGGTEKMRLDASGNLGIGMVPSGNHKLEINGGFGISGIGIANFGSWTSIQENGWFDAGGNFLHNAIKTSGVNDTWLYRNNGYAARYRLINSTNQHQWHIAPSGTAGNAIPWTQAMTLDANGRLLVGATSALNNGTIEALGTSRQAFVAQVTNNVNSLFQGFDSSANAVFQVTGGSVLSVNSIYAFGTNPLIFGANSTERARISSAGNFGIGVNPSYRLHVQGSGSTSATYAVVANNSLGTNIFAARDDGYFIIPYAYNTTTASAANVFVDGNGGLLRSTSSLRYKKDVADATHGLAEVLQLRPVVYKGKSSFDGDKVFGGLIAEEVHAIGLTEFVDYDADGQPDALHYGHMVSLLAKAIQELTARVAALEAA